MEAGFLVLIIAVSITFVINWMKRRHKEKPQGILNIICNDLEDGPQLFLELTVPIEDVISKKSVTFEVNVMGLHSHE